MTLQRTTIERLECSCGAAVDLSTRIFDAVIDVLDMLRDAHRGDGHVLTVTCSAGEVAP